MLLLVISHAVFKLMMTVAMVTPRHASVMPHVITLETVVLTSMILDALLRRDLVLQLVTHHVVSVRIQNVLGNQETVCVIKLVLNEVTAVVTSVA